VNHRAAEARRLADPDVARDDRVEDQRGEVLAHLALDVAREARAPVVHRQEHPGDGEARIELALDELERVEQASETLERYVLDLWDATHAPQNLGVRLDGVDMDRLILAGASPRGMMALTRTARVVAWLAGRTYLTPDDIRSMAQPALGHRIFFTPVYELRRAQLADELITQILEKVPTPR